MSRHVPPPPPLSPKSSDPKKALDFSSSVSTFTRHKWWKDASEKNTDTYLDLNQLKQMASGLGIVGTKIEGGKRTNRNRQDFVDSIQEKIKDGSDESERMLDIMQKGGLNSKTDVKGLINKHFSKTKTSQGRKKKSAKKKSAKKSASPPAGSPAKRTLAV